MIITSLVLENIRSYDKAYFTFTEGITFLSGDIGSGKSSILQGIEFAFFGFKRNELDGNQLLRNGCSSGSVTLGIKKGNTSIEIYRTLKKTKTGIVQENGYIKIDGALIELTPTQINAQVYEILNLPKSFISKDRHLIYRFSIYTPQEQLKEILYSQHDKRLEVIRKLFSIDKYKQLTTGIEYFLKDLREKKITFKTRLEYKEETSSSYEKTLDEFNNKKKEYTKELEKFEPLQKLLEELKSQREKKLTSLEEYQEKFVKISSSLEKLEYYSQRKEELQEEVETIVKSKEKNSLKTLKESLKKLQEEKLLKEKSLIEKKKEYEVLLNEQEVLQKYLLQQEEITSLKKQLQKEDIEKKQKIERNLLEIQRKIEVNSKSISQEEEISKKKQYLSSQLFVIEKQFEEYNKETETIQHQDSCIVCKQEISLEHKKFIQKEAEKKKEDADKQKKSLLAQADEIEKKLHKIKQIKKEQESLLEKKIILQQELKQLEKEKEKIITLKDEITKLEKKLKKPKIISSKELSSQITHYRDLIENIKDELSKLTLQIEQLHTQIEAFTSLDEKEHSIKEKITKLHEQIEKKPQFLEKKEKIQSIISALKEQQQNIQEEISKKEPLYSKLQVQTTQLKTTLDSLQKTLAELEKKKKEFEKNEKELEKILQKENFLLHDAISISSTIEKKLFTRFYITATQEFQRIFKELIEDQELDVRLNEEFSILIEQNGYDIDIRHLSGGEKSSLAIAYKLALKKTIESFFPQEQYLDVLLFDEPTDGFSAQQVQRLGQVLKELQVRQIFLVSHDEKIESIANEIIHIDKKNHLSSFS